MVFILAISFCFFSCKQNSFETVQNKVVLKFKDDPKKREDVLFLLGKSRDEKHYTSIFYKYTSNKQKK